MIVESRDRDGIAICTLKGSFESPRDLEAFAAEMDQQIAAGRTRFVLDLHLLAYLNSNAVGRIIKYRKRVQEAGGDLVVLQPTKTVREVLELLQLLPLLKPYGSEAEALVALGGGSSAAVPASAPPPPAAHPPAGATPAEILFRFEGEPEVAGRIDGIDRRRVRFSRPAPGEPGKAVGAWVCLRLRIPRYRRPTYFELAGTLTESSEGGTRFTVEFTGLAEEERADVEQFAEDLRKAGQLPGA